MVCRVKSGCILVRLRTHDLPWSFLTPLKQESMNALEQVFSLLNLGAPTQAIYTTRKFLFNTLHHQCAASLLELNTPKIMG